VALETIRSLEPSNVNYKKAMNLLVNRFDNKVLHFQAHDQATFGLKGVEKGSSKGLRICEQFAGQYAIPWPISNKFWMDF